jgi:hypothetical protein
LVAFVAAGDFGVDLVALVTLGDFGERGEAGAFDDAASDAFDTTDVDLARAGVDFREPAMAL